MSLLSLRENPSLDGKYRTRRNERMNRRTFLGTTALAGAASAMGGSLMAEGSEQPLASIAQIRVARPTDKLAAIVSFYHEALGLPILGHFENHEHYSGVMFGIPNAQFHLE